MKLVYHPSRTASPWTVACPYCEAKPGEPCTGNRGHPTKACHHARRTTARELVLRARRAVEDDQVKRARAWRAKQ